MDTIGTSAWREFTVVGMVSAAGVTLAAVIAFVPWFPGAGEPRSAPAVVQIHAPVVAPVPAELVLTGEVASAAVGSP